MITIANNDEGEDDYGSEVKKHEEEAKEKKVRKRRK